MRLKFTAALLLIALILFSGCSGRSVQTSVAPADDGRSPAERRQIADALFAMLHSPLTNEVDLKLDDPRIPEAIRHLNPQDIELSGNDAVVMCAGKPGEYHLSRLPNQPTTWILYVAGPGYNGHQEILRFEHD